MNLLFVTSDVPSLQGEAVNRVNWELLDYFVDQGIKIFLLIIIDFRGKKFPSAEEEIWLTNLAQRRIHLVSIIDSQESTLLRNLSKRTYFHRYIKPREEVLYPWLTLETRVLDLVRKYDVDAIFQSWDRPGVAATNKVRGIPKYLYYGEPDHKPGATRVNQADRFGLARTSFAGRLNLFKTKRELKYIEKFHVRMVKNFDVVGCITYSNVLPYRNAGVKNVKYVPNIWTKPNRGLENQGNATESG
ncbi:MAG: hypothetical protein HOL08_05650, partial [Opitutae bacterium]|nr:hypothetical protein [Opitutae bacterium]